MLLLAVNVIILTVKRSRVEKNKWFLSFSMAAVMRETSTLVLNSIFPFKNESPQESEIQKKVSDV